MKVYVGTYRKYNEGSLKGGWIDLDTFKNYDEFIKAAKKLHKGESDPELMIQDVENDGLDWQAGFNGEMASDYADYWKVKSEAEANGGEAKEPIATVTRNLDKNGIEIKFFERPAQSVIDDLKSRRWRWSRFAGCWYTRYSEDAMAYAAAVANSSSVETKAASNPRKSSMADALERDAKASLAEYRAWIEADPARVARLWKRDVDGHIRGIVYAVKLDDGEWLTVDKKSIVTRHCEGEDDGRGRSMADAQAGCNWFCTEAGFKISNNVRALVNGKRKPSFYLLYKREDWNSKSWNIVSNDGRAVLDRVRGGWLYREISEREWREIRRAYAWRAISNRRRVNAYWKRFGASRLHTWTYWTEA